MLEHKNNLNQSNNPYLLQHAANPVHWQMWDQEILKQAQVEDRLLVISIGYSSCHWCHVMEKESFEQDEVAQVMNKDFINIKVDREERPDIDEVYMTAVQLITGRGGWPLNVICLPDGQPVWGATYVAKEKWIQVLSQLAQLYRDDREKMLRYAENLTRGIKQSQLIALSTDKPLFTKEEAKLIFDQWFDQLDHEEGGANRAPKFPMPVNLEFMLHYGARWGDQRALDHVALSLRKMAYGGIYDQLGGGFARYSVDSFWKVPHFEKMLYDNAQLIGVYSQAYRQSANELYADVVAETVAWLEAEMTASEGAFFSALDADSEGEEGKFYIWSKEELQTLIPSTDWELFSSYYNLNKKGYWEKGNYILLRDKSDHELEKAFGLSQTKLALKRAEWKNILLEARSKRVRPGLDDKAITSWNAMMISGLTEAYRSFGDQKYLDLAKTNARWIYEQQCLADNSLWHVYRAGQSKVSGLLEDYTFAIKAFADLYEVTGLEFYLEQAQRWMKLAKADFEDPASGLFFTRSLKSESLIARSQETADNVIPATNSVMAHNLYRLSIWLDRPEYKQQAEKMLGHLKKRVLEYGESYANWGRLLLLLADRNYEVAVSGTDAARLTAEMQAHYLPQVIFATANSESELPLLKGRFQADKTQIFVCENNSCRLPVSSVLKALAQLG